MPATSPFDLLADELGAVAGRVEREAALRMSALVADLDRRFAEKELQLERLQKQLEAVVLQTVVAWDARITEKLSTLKDGKDGADGTNGQDGKDGAEGPAGPAGEAGAVGEPGPQGLPGMPGDTGARGESGAVGKDGADGATGLNGKDGAPGKLPRVKAWTEGTVHYDGDVVVFKGGLYQALQDTASLPSTAAWICLAAPGKDGRDGVDGKSMTIKDTYDATQKYEALDVVTLDYKWYVARCDNPGECPGPNWKAGPGLGRTGKPGPQGEKGLKGDVGRAAPVIVDWETRAEAFEVTPIMSDGSYGPAVSLRELFERFQAEAG